MAIYIVVVEETVDRSAVVSEIKYSGAEMLDEGRLMVRARERSAAKIRRIKGVKAVVAVENETVVTKQVDASASQPVHATPAPVNETPALVAPSKALEAPALLDLVKKEEVVREINEVRAEIRETLRQRLVKWLNALLGRLKG